MSFRFGMPLPLPDNRLGREDPLATARTAAPRRRQLQHQQQHHHHQTHTGIDDNGTASLTRPIAPAETSLTANAPVSNRRHIVTPDPISFRYLENEPSVAVVDRSASLEGYEIYIVEQWVCSRRSPTIVITTYTGDPNHAAIVGVLSIPEDERDWSPRLKLYFQTMQQYHARPKTSPLGEILVTNLSSFPSALTVIAVQDGDIRRHRQEFIVNENLKRLGCSGRSGLTLSEPTRATQEKFQSLYKTSEKIPFCESVLELIKMCQTALFIFGMLDPQYIDGLLCDVTETAIGDWWTQVGGEYCNSEPADGILGPSTVAALLGILMGARNRLAWYGISVPKDVFDMEAMRKGIGSFQKDLKLSRTRRLDHQTLRRLHGVTSKAAAGEAGWGVQKAIKSTVEGFGGKRGELVYGMVGGKDKGNVGDIETMDMDKFISLIYGERPKWLWFGKARRSPAALPLGMDHLPDRSTAKDIANGLFGKDGKDDTPLPGIWVERDEGDKATTTTANAITNSGGSDAAVVAGAAGASGASGTSGAADTVGAAGATGSASTGAAAGIVAATAPTATNAVNTATPPNTTTPASSDATGTPQRKDTNTPIYSTPPSGSAYSMADNANDRDWDLKRSVFKTVAGRVNDARSGLGRIRDAVGGGLRGHTSRPSRDESMSGTLYHPDATSAATVSSASTMPHHGMLTGPTTATVGRAFTWKNKPEEYLNKIRREIEMGGSPFRDRNVAESDTEGDATATAMDAGFASAMPGYESLTDGRALQRRREAVTSMSHASVAGSVADESDLEGPLLEAERCVGSCVVGLLRRHSIAGARREPRRLPPEFMWARRLSFSAAEEAVLTWGEIVDDSDMYEEAIEDDKEGDWASGGGGGEEEGGSRVLLAAAAAAAGPVAMATTLASERCLYEDLSRLKETVGPAVMDRVLALEALDTEYEHQQDELQTLLFRLSGAYDQVLADSEELLGAERNQGAEMVRDIEALMGRVEYEIGSLVSKVHDVEEGVRQFRLHVEQVEERAEELKKQLETESWLHWFVRSMTGIGTGPNIVHGGPS